MIQLNHIHKYFFKDAANEVHALNDLSFEVPAGQFLVLLGSNGSGKSTLLNCIGGSVLPNEGQVLIDQTDVSGLREDQRSKWISRVFQNPLTGTASDLTVIENFRLASLRTRSKSFRIGIDSKFRSLIKEQITQLNLGLENKLDQPIGGLSGGQRQSLTLLMAVMDTSKILLLDEPASALDPRTAELIMQLAEKLIKQYQLTAILVTHNLKEAVTYGDRVIIMREGKISHDLNKTGSPQLSMTQLLDLF
ncbi:MAG: ATP-binding cassette domain-containing protein [Bacteroidetes bacterium]|nr:ATP-binding cassette domain-containing protein [Bacteroidota bacterium]